MFNPFDILDYKILQKLKQNSRIPAVEIARDLGESERKIRKRIDRMANFGVGKFTIVVDPLIFGYGITVDILLEVTPDREVQVMEQLVQMTELSYIANEENGKQISIQARFKTVGDMYFFLRTTLAGIDGVSITNYALVPRVLRDVDQWMPPINDFGRLKGNRDTME
jgi:DNA-binding Lrp family transcriptional regulator